MNNEDYKILEYFLSKLQIEMKYKFCIVPEYIQDGYYISIFDNITGKKIKESIKPTIQECVQEILKDK